MTISTKVYNDQAIASINRLSGELQTIQSKISTGKKQLRTSDDPAAASKIIFAKEQKVRIEGFNKNIDRAKSKLMQSESAIATVINATNRAYELTLQAKNDTNSAEDRLIIAMEVQSLRDEIFNLSNSRDSNGDYLFAGFKVTQKPFSMNVDGTIAVNGDRGAHLVQTSDTRKSPTGLDGQEVFVGIRHGETVESIFETFDELISDLKKDSVNDQSVSKISNALNHFNVQQTKIGTSINGLDQQKDVNEKRMLLMDQDLSNMEDADLSKLVTELQGKLVSRNAAQQAFVKISQESLFNYVR